jgi:hypothetical protein
MKYWEIIADNLSKAGWSWGYVSAIDFNGRTIWVADAHRDDGKCFVARTEEKLTAFVNRNHRFLRERCLARLAGCLYRISESNSPSLTRVRIFIFGLTTAVVRMI